MHLPAPPGSSTLAFAGRKGACHTDQANEKRTGKRGGQRERSTEQAVAATALKRGQHALPPPWEGARTESPHIRSRHRLQRPPPASSLESQPTAGKAIRVPASGLCGLGQVPARSGLRTPRVQRGVARPLQSPVALKRRGLGAPHDSLLRGCPAVLRNFCAQSHFLRKRLRRRGPGWPGVTVWSLLTQRLKPQRLATGSPGKRRKAPARHPPFLLVFIQVRQEP